MYKLTWGYADSETKLVTKAVSDRLESHHVLNLHLV